MTTEETTTAEFSPTVFDTKAFTEGLKAQIKAAGGTAAFYKQNDIIKQLTKATFQAMLDAVSSESIDTVIAVFLSTRHSQRYK